MNDVQAAKEVEFFLHARWPLYPFLILVRWTPGAYSPTPGFMWVKGEERLREDSQPIVYLADLHDLGHGARLKDVQVLVYDSIEAMVRDGWRVD